MIKVLLTVILLARVVFEANVSNYIFKPFVLVAILLICSSGRAKNQKERTLRRIKFYPQCPEGSLRKTDTYVCAAESFRCLPETIKHC